MSRPKLITRPRKLTLHLPEDLMLRLDLYLVSGATGKIPQGAYAQFFIERMNEYFAKMASATQEFQDV